MNDSKVSAAQARATAKWEKNNYDRSLIRFPKGTQERIKATGESINGFVNRLVKAALDGPQPVQAPQPQPPATTATAPADVPEGYTLIPCRPDQEPLKVLLPVDKHYNQRIQALVKAGRAPSRAVFVMQALDKHLSEAQPRDQYELPDEFFTGDPADNPPPLQ